MSTRQKKGGQPAKNHPLSFENLIPFMLKPRLRGPGHCGNSAAPSLKSV